MNSQTLSLDNFSIRQTIDEFFSMWHMLLFSVQINKIANNKKNRMSSLL